MSEKCKQVHNPDKTQISVTQDFVDKVGYSDWMRVDLQRKSDEMMEELKIRSDMLLFRRKRLYVQLMRSDPLDVVVSFDNESVFLTKTQNKYIRIGGSKYLAIMYLLFLKKQLEQKIEVDYAIHSDVSLQVIYDNFKSLIGE